MLRYIARRLLMMPLLLLGIVTITFALSSLTRGDPLVAIIGERQMDNPEVVAAARTRWGLDRPLPERYLRYVGNLLGGDLGQSIRTKRPVSADLLDRLPATLELVIAAMLVGVCGGIFLGVVSARFHNGPIDHVARLFALLGSSLPVFWSGLLVLYIFSVVLGWLPGPGRLDAQLTPPPELTGFLTIDALVAGDWKKLANALAHLVLPACVLGWLVMGLISRMVRSSVLDVLGQDYVLAARAKGLSNVRVLLNHALRNAMIPALTVIGFSFAYLITGAVLTETIFSWPGIGSYTVSSSRALDFPAISGVTILGGCAFLIANLVTDLAYMVVDPRVRLG